MTVDAIANRPWFWLLLCMSVLPLSCTKVRTLEDLCGTYVADYDIATETIELKRDGSFLQHIEIKSDHRTLESHGSWTFDSTEFQVWLRDYYVQVVNPFGKILPDLEKPKAGIAMFPISTFPKPLRFGMAEGPVVYKRRAEK